jgi:hypothetical protein
LPDSKWQKHNRAKRQHSRPLTPEQIHQTDAAATASVISFVKAANPTQPPPSASDPQSQQHARLRQCIRQRFRQIERTDINVPAVKP